MTGRKRFVRMAMATGLTVILATVLSSVVQATIVGVSGQITLIGSPASVMIDALESNTTMFAFDEQQCVALAAPLKVNISVPGFYGDGSIKTPALIAAGTKVSSHYVTADRASSVAKIELEGTLTFDANILGLITANGSLGNSDVLGAPGTVYPTGLAGRELQWGGGDWVDLDPALKSVTIHVINSRHTDQMRVITECSGPPPPPPPPGTQGCTPGYWKQTQHFDSWKVYQPTDSFNAVFGLTGPFANSLTLLDALNQGGGGIYALGRHAVAALLDTANGGVAYGYTTAQVIAMTQAAYTSGDADQILATKDLFAAQNEKGCPLN